MSEQKNVKLWGGRFSEKTSELTDRFNGSISFDYKLYRQDITGSIAHARMLEKIGVLNAKERELIENGLRGIYQDIEDGKVEFSPENEDIHMNVESILIERIGETGKKLHTGRSRNDQVAVDFKMYMVEKTLDIIGLVHSLMSTILEIAKDNEDTIMSGYTHLQKAQPVTLAFHMMAYFQMFKRDYERFYDCLERMDELPLGSGALAGVSYPSDREFLADELGFERVTLNAMDSVSDRDFALEFMSCASILFMHMSRLSEELIIWSSNEFGYAIMDDKYSTGSSIMPQKKNPDVAELIRGKTGRIYGNLFTLLTVMKGLPLAYNKDMQEDKEPVFDTVETLEISLEIFANMLSTLKFNRAKMRDGAKLGFLNATDAADYLVKKGMEFRNAHEVVGKLVAFAEHKGIAIDDIPLDDLLTHSELFDGDFYDAVALENCIENRKSFGSTSKESVAHSIRVAEEFLRDEVEYL
jgi:argininosuccinate lyase